MHPTSSWYAEGLRWIGSLLHGAANYLDRPEVDPMPRHLSAEEVLSDVRNRANTGFEASQRPHYW